jgi:dTDP-4-dehydrorhamnose reductase
MRLLVLGRSGVLGSALARTAARRGLEVVAGSRPEWGLDDPRRLEEQVRHLAPDAVLNAAAFTDVTAAERPEMRDAVLRANVAAPGALARAAAALGIPLVHVSTDYVFDGRKGSPYSEGDRPHPLQVYGQSKLEGERAVLDAHDGALVARTSTLYGDADGGRGTYVTAILRQARAARTLEVVEQPVACPTWSHDLAEALLDLLQAKARGIVHAVNDGACSRLQLARAIVEEAGLGDSVEVSARDEALGGPARPAYSVLATDHLARLLGRPLRGWREALTSYLATTARRVTP